MVNQIIIKVGMHNEYRTISEIKKSSKERQIMKDWKALDISNLPEDLKQLYDWKSIKIGHNEKILYREREELKCKCLSPLFYSALSTKCHRCGGKI